MNVRNRFFAMTFAVIALLLSALAPAGVSEEPAAPADEEDALLEVLESEESAPAKCRACDRLKIIGSVKAVGALGAVLSDEGRVSRGAVRARVDAVS